MKSFFFAGLLLVALGGVIYFSVVGYRASHYQEDYVPTNWALVNIIGTNSKGYIYVSYSPDSIKGNGNLVQIDEVNDYKMVRGHDSVESTSVKFTKEYNCKTKEFRLVAFDAFSKKNAKGAVISSSKDLKNWTPTP